VINPSLKNHCVEGRNQSLPLMSPCTVIETSCAAPTSLHAPHVHNASSNNVVLINVELESVVGSSIFKRCFNLQMQISEIIARTKSFFFLPICLSWSVFCCNFAMSWPNREKLGAGEIKETRGFSMWKKWGERFENFNWRGQF